MLRVQNLGVAYKDYEAVRDVSFELHPGEWLMLIGPNGAGKSTIIKAVSQSLKYNGEVTLDGQDISKLHARQLAKKMAVLQQSHAVGYAFTVEQLVRFGRYAYTSAFSRVDTQGERLVEEAIDVCCLSRIRHQNVLTLSGGELQRAFLAQAFAQDAPLLLLDEPASHLDMAYQQTLFELVETWRKHDKRAVLSVVHDVQMARRYGTHALLLKDGRVTASGIVDDVFTRGNLQTVYAMDVNAWLSWLHAPWLDGQTGTHSV